MEYDFWGTGIYVYVGKLPTAHLVNIYIDGVYQTQLNEWANPSQAQQLLWSKTNLTSGAHTIKLLKVSSNPDLCIDIDYFLWHGLFWRFYIESRTISTAKLSWKSLNTTASVSLYIDGTNRTAALGGPWTGDVNTPIDVSQYISTPGLHTMEFVPSLDTELDVTLDCWGLI